MMPKVGMRVLVEKGLWANHVGVIREVGVRDLFVRVDLENGFESLTVPAFLSVVSDDEVSRDDRADGTSR